MPQRNLVIVLVAAAISYACYVRGEQNPFARFASTGLEAIDQSALEAVPSRELFDAAMKGMVGVLNQHGDEHSRYFDQRQTELLMEEIHQHFGGIGVRIHFVGEPPRLVVVAPPDANTPAARAKLARGDEIAAIDGRPTHGMKMDDVLVAMRGPAGTSIRLTIVRDGQEQPPIELVRENIRVESVLGDIRERGRWRFQLPEDRRIALVRVRAFGDLTAIEFQRAIDQVVADGAQAAVLDLRDNAGGTLDAAVDVCSRLLPPDLLVVETRTRHTGALERRLTKDEGQRFALPLAVLINQNSASAAEIVAAALQDHGRAIIVGQRTYGKGTVQQLIPMQAGKSTLKLTWAGFWRPSGENIHRRPGAAQDATWGVRPDSGFEVALPRQEYDQWQRYRDHRDLAGLMSPEELASLLSDNLPAPPADFVDRPLARAVEGLQKALDKAVE
jgi:carboxyl-terminal processing protease